MWDSNREVVGDIRESSVKWGGGEPCFSEFECAGVEEKESKEFDYKEKDEVLLEDIREKEYNLFKCLR